ncbi:MAG: hypothetical protein QNJ46_18375, partial [Leptolyngbyaceae cyanobacterium MO_188.B28]|nr:hypothetical protein [Leptolyngbyaceae cyanobacterium MO_188.B28]
MAKPWSAVAPIRILDSDAARARDLCNRLRFLDYEPVMPEAGLADEDGIAVVLGDVQNDAGIERTLEELKTRRPGLPCLCLQAR